MPQLLEIRECIAEAFDVKLTGSSIAAKKRRIRWDTPEMTDWVTRLTEAVTKLEDRVEQLLRACDKVDIALNLLEQVNYDAFKFQSVLTSIQKTIDEMSLSGYSDLDSWVRVVGDKMAEVLSKRLETALRAWNKAFKAQAKQKSSKEDFLSDDVGPSDFEQGDDSIPPMAVPANVALEIVLRNQEISTVPSLPSVRSILLTTLHDFIGVVCNLQRPRSGRYEVFDSITAKSSRGDSICPETFDNLDVLIPSDVVADAYSVVEDHIQEASAFVDQWLAYQSLWDTQVSDVAASVGNDIEKWQSLLLEASEARTTLDSSATITEFGPIVVKYAKVQSQINLKYDSWQKEMQSSFAGVLGQCIVEAHDRISSAKNRLEETTLDSSSTDNIVLGVTFIQECKQKFGMWSKEIDTLSESEKVLKRQRYVFHGEWMETSVVKGLSEGLLQILERRTRTMEQQVPVLQARVSAEDKSANKQLTELLKSWEQDKPLRGSMSPSEAVAVLEKYELTMKKAHLHHENLIRAKDALGLDHSVENTEVVDCLNELADLKEVWEAMMEPFTELEKLKEMVCWTFLLHQ
jgi:dynein heavy chain 1, cytosolic